MKSGNIIFLGYNLQEESKMVYPEAFGVKDDKQLQSLLKLAAEKPSKIFQGYEGIYFYKHYGRAEFIVNTKRGENGLIAVSSSLHLMYNNFYTLRIEEKVHDENLEIICLCSTLDGDTATLPVYFTMSDVRPSYMPGDIITFQGAGFFFEEGFGIYETAVKAEAVLGFKPTTVMGTEMHLADGFMFAGNGKDEIGNAIYSRIRKFEIFPGIPASEKNESLPVYVITIGSRLGEIPVVIPPSYLKEHKDILDKLISGKELYVAGSFYFSGDVAEKEYKNGRILDEENLLRLLRASFGTGYERIEPYLASDCIYNGYKNSFNTKEDTIKWLKHVDVESKKNAKTIHRYYLATVTKVQNSEEAEYPVGKRLIVYDSESSNGYLGMCFIELNPNKQISKINFIYKNTYEFLVDQIPLNAEEKLARGMELVKLERSSDEWKQFFLEWINGEDVDLVAFYGGLEPVCSSIILGKESHTKEDVFISMRDYLNEMLQKKTAEYKISDLDNVFLEMSLKGRISRITVLNTL